MNLGRRLGTRGDFGGRDRRDEKGVEGTRDRMKNDKEMMRECIRDLEKKVIELEGTKGKDKGSVEVPERNRRKKGWMDVRLAEIEKKIEMREREERKRNTLIKGVGVKVGKRKNAVEEVLKVIGAKVDGKVEKVKRLGGEEGKKGKLF